jgi:hypothetical protein
MSKKTKRGAVAYGIGTANYVPKVERKFVTAWRGILSRRDPAALAGRSGHPNLAPDAIATLPATSKVHHAGA